MARPKVAKTKDFVVAIASGNYNAINDFGSQHRSKKSTFSFYEVLKHIQQGEIKKLMKKLVELLINYVKTNMDENSETVDWGKLSSEQCKSVGLFINSTTDIGLACIQCDIPICNIELLQIAVFLNGIMISMPESMDYVKNFISFFCEKVFPLHIVEDSEIFLSNVLLFLTRKTLTNRAAKIAVKRLYAVRQALKKVMGQDGPKAIELWTLFSACAISDTYLSMVEGRKLIALVMGMDIDRLEDLHAKIKAYVPSSPVKHAAAYGKIYFNVWLEAVTSGSNEMIDVIEISCLQQYLLMALECKQLDVLMLARKVFHFFVTHKKNNNVSKMLFSLYRPLVWRFVKHPNGLYRAAASQLLLDIFPLEDPTGGVVHNDQEINDQLLMIQALLLDDFPIVRITTLLGISVSMTVNWEVFPEESLKSFFRIIVDDMSRDSSTPEVRLAVVKGLACLIENPLTVETLSKILPKLIGLFHDTNDNVRNHFCQLLIKVKKISGIKFFEIVPVEHVFARMEVDSHAIKKCLTNLLHNSYFPTDKDPKVWLGRCLEIMKCDNIPSRVFFTYATNFIDVHQSVKFMMQAVKAVHFFVQTKSTATHTDLVISDKENIQKFSEYIDTLEEDVVFGNIKVVNKLMESIAIMWLSLKPDSAAIMGEDKKIMKIFVAKLGKSLSELCLYYMDTEAWESVFYLTSFFPTKYVPSLASLCFAKLKNLPPEAQETDYLTLLECLANQFKMDELLSILKDWIETGLKTSNTFLHPPSKKKRGTGRKSESIIPEQTKAFLANRMLNTILKSRNLQKHALIQRETLNEILYLSDGIQKTLEKAKQISEQDVEFFSVLVKSVVTISVHLQDDPNYGKNTSVPFVNEFVQWTTAKLLKHIVRDKGETNHLASLVLEICQNLCKILADAIMIGFIEPNNCLYLDFTLSLLRTDFGYKFLRAASKVLFKHAATSQYMIILDHGDTVMMENHLRYLSKVFVLMSNEAMLEKLPETEQDVIMSYKDVMEVFASNMHIVNNHVLPELSAEVFKCILKNILNSSASKCAKIVEEMAEDPFDTISFTKTGKFFMTIIVIHPRLIRTYVKYLTKMLKGSQDIDISYWIAYWMIAWNLLHADSVTLADVRELNSLVFQLEKSIHNIYPRSKDSEQNNVHDSSEPVPLHLFQDHCHAQLIRLKNYTRSKLKPKSSKN